MTIKTKKSKNEEPNTELPDETVETTVVAKNIAKFNDLNGKFIHVKVGSPDWDKDLMRSEIEKVEKQVTNFLESNGVECLVFVTHCFVDINIIEPQTAKGKRN